MKERVKNVPSIKKKLLPLLVIYTAVTAVIFSLIASVLYSNALRDTKKSVSASLETACRFVSDCFKSVSFTNNVIIENSNMQVLLEGYSQKDYISQFDTDIAVYEILNGAWSDNTEILRISLFVEGKKYSSGSGVIHDLSLIKEAEWYNELQGITMLLKTNNPSDKISLTSSFVPSNDISMCSKIMSDGKVLAYMRIDISNDHLNNLLIPALYSDGSQIFLVDSNGNIIVGNADFLSADDMQLISGIKGAASGGSLSLTGENKKYYAQYSSLNSHGMRTLELIPKSDLLGSYRKALILILIIALLILSLISVLTYYIIAIFSRRLHTYSIDTSTGDAPSAPFSELAPLEDIAGNMSELKTQNRLFDLSFTANRISPHFLYNALESVVWNLDELSKDDIAHVLSSLSHFYRLLLISSSFVCKLEKEIQLISRYMELQKECFGSEISFSLDVPPGLSDLYIPSFILQPLIENSFKHGFSNKTHNLHISVSAEIISEKLVIILKDNGCGIDKYTLEKINGSADTAADTLSLHEGIKNIRKRIDMLCRGDYAMEFDSSLTGGTTVKITLPVVSDPAFFDVNPKETSI